MNMNRDDPFEQTQRNVEDCLRKANELLDSWKRVYQTVSSPSNPELLSIAHELDPLCDTIEMDLEDLTEAFKAAEVNPSNFHLTDLTMSKRRTFLRNSEKSLKNIRDTLSNPPSKSSWSNTHSNSPWDDYSYSDREAANSRQLEQESQQVTIIMREQDQHLDSMAGTVVNLKEIAGTVGREVDDQNFLIDELGDRVDRTENKLGRAMRRVKEILRKEEGESQLGKLITHIASESKSGYCVCCLIIVLIILLVLVVLL